MHPPARALHAKRVSGVTLVEAALVICLVGVLLSVFIPMFLRKIRTSKIAEAAEQLSHLHYHTATYFSVSHETLEGGEARRRCLPPSAGPAPAETSVDPVIVDFAAEDTPGHETWSALGFAPDHPLRYRYRFYVHSPEGCELTNSEAGPLVTLQAEGDLDGDGRFSLFERSAQTNDRGELVPLEILYIRNRVE